MSKLKVQHGVSRIRRAKLQTSVDQTVADDIDLMASWSNNETYYIINELLRFAIAQEEDFQRYKASVSVDSEQPARSTKTGSIVTRSAADSAAKAQVLPTVPTSHA